MSKLTRSPDAVFALKNNAATLPNVAAEPETLGEPVTRRQVISSIVFDPPLDASLFSQEVPEGYSLVQARPTVVRTTAGPETTEQQALDGLRLLAERSNDVFPAGDASGPQFGGIQPRRFGQGEVDQQVKDVLEAFTRVRVFIMSSKATYLGAGITLGDATKSGRASDVAIISGMEVVIICGTRKRL